MLNACYSNELAEPLVTDIDCVIGMTADIADDAAVLFSQMLYAALFDGRSIAEAFDTAKGALAARYIEDSENPVLRVRPGIDPTAVRIV